MGKVNWDDTEVLINSVRDRERRRIRRALLAQLKGFIGPATKLDIMEIIDTATRKGAGRKKGR